MKTINDLPKEHRPEVRKMLRENKKEIMQPCINICRVSVDVWPIGCNIEGCWKAKKIMVIHNMEGR